MKIPLSLTVSVVIAGQDTWFLGIASVCECLYVCVCVCVCVCVSTPKASGLMWCNITPI